MKDPRPKEIFASLVHNRNLYIKVNVCEEENLVSKAYFTQEKY